MADDPTRIPVQLAIKRIEILRPGKLEHSGWRYQPVLIVGDTELDLGRWQETRELAIDTLWAGLTHTMEDHGGD